jgi:hypothetical protein
LEYKNAALSLSLVPAFVPSFDFHQPLAGGLPAGSRPTHPALCHATVDTRPRRGIVDVATPRAFNFITGSARGSKKDNENGDTARNRDRMYHAIDPCDRTRMPTPLSAEIEGHRMLGIFRLFCLFHLSRISKYKLYSRWKVYLFEFFSQVDQWSLIRLSAYFVSISVCLAAQNSRFRTLVRGTFLETHSVLRPTACRLHKAVAYLWHT